jgi:hypothetical protein
MSLCAVRYVECGCVLAQASLAYIYLRRALFLRRLIAWSKVFNVSMMGSRIGTGISTIFN